MGVPAGNTIPTIPADVFTIKSKVLGQLGDDGRVTAELPLAELLSYTSSVGAKAETALLPCTMLSTLLSPEELLIVVDEL